MITVQLVLYVLALVCLALATIGVGHPRVSLLACGLFCWLLGDVLRV